MKRSIVVLLAALLVAVSCGMAAAEVKKEEGVEVEAGLKVWYNKWKSQDPDPAFGTINFDYTTLVGPAVEIKFPYHFYAEASYLVSLSDYEATVAGILKMTADRKDLDLAVGYRVIPQIGIFAGYKDVKQDWNLMGLDSGSLKLTGPMFGVRGDVPVNETFGVYASYTYLKTKLESSAVGALTTKNNAPGSIIEAGVKAELAHHLSGTLGYKVESTKEKNTNIKDTFSGVTLGVMYAF